MEIQLLSRKTSLILFLVSWGIVSFGQPAWSFFAAFLASIIGYALFFRVLISYSDWKKRFFLGTAWFMAVQLFQLSWTLSHPYLYILAPYLLYAFFMGIQFGLISAFVNLNIAAQWVRVFVVCACWTLLEWSRTFFLSGFAFNPTGMAMAGNLYSMQMSSLTGIYGLSFYVLLTNLLFLRAYLNHFAWKQVVLCLCVATVPYIFGSWQVEKHRHGIKKSPLIDALLVQTAFPVEEEICFASREEMLKYVLEEWKQIYRISEKYKLRQLDLLALPEFVVPYGTYSFVYPYEDVKSIIEEVFGDAALERLAPIELPFADSESGTIMVSNAFLSQTLANLFQCSVVVGLEDAEDIDGQRHYFSSALLFEPLKKTEEYRPQRYEKRVLVPMGEYIPFSFCRGLAENYGIFGSFTPGESAVVWKRDRFKLGVSICYEEMFGEIMRENRVKGAEMLLNITSDAWFPHSKLIRQHFEHARLRTVENGIPLIRACNTGVTGCVDALGRDIAILGKNDEEREDLSDALFVSVPTYHFRTLYSGVGDRLIIGISILIVLLFFRARIA